MAGCVDPGGNMQSPGPGSLLVTITPSSTPVANLQLQSATLHFQNLSVFGDVAPNGRSMLSAVQLDLLGQPQSYSFDMLPQGLYSRVRFNVSEAQIQGSWRGHPLQIEVDSGDLGGGVIDLRSPSGVEVQPGQDGSFAIDESLSAWFDGNILDSAPPDATGKIVIDENVNRSVATQLSVRMVASFTLSQSVQ
jgi:hypothetical protein